MRSRRAQSSLRASCGEPLAACSISCRAPRAQNSLSRQGGARHRPRNACGGRERGAPLSAVS